MNVEHLAVAMVPMTSVQPYAKNSRAHSSDQIDAVCASIREFGFTNPILLGSEGVIIAGHARFEAAGRLGLTEIPAIHLSHLTPDQERALVIADNKIAEGSTWDEELLREELRALDAANFDMGMMGFDTDELADLLKDIEEGNGPDLLTGADDVPPLEPEIVSRLGDVWILGEHRLICGDSTSKAVVRKVVGKLDVDCIWTDPPYNVNYEGSAGKIQNDNLGATEFQAFLEAAFSAAASALRPGGPIYVAHADTEGLAFRSAFVAAGLKLSGCLAWVKPSLVLGRSDYQWRHEPILYGWRPGAAHQWFGGRAETTVIEDTAAAPVRVMPDGTVQIDVGDLTIVVAGTDLSVTEAQSSLIRFDKPSRNKEHPTMKPVGLIARMLRNSTDRGGIVLDPFGGSGSTLIACEMLGRKARLVELEPRFVDVIVRRWQEATGKDAVAEGTRIEFSAVRERRRPEAESNGVRG